VTKTIYLWPEDPPSSVIKVRDHQIQLRGANRHEQAYVTITMLNLAPAMSDSVQCISILKRHHQIHFGFFDDRRPVVAHCHSKPTRICILRSGLTPNILVHETAHALTFKTQGEAPSAEGLLGDWLRVAQESYSKKRFGAEHKFPSSGFLDEYSSHNVLEDIAMFTQYAYSFHRDKASPLRKVKHITNVDTRYFRKLELLLKYGFIHQKDFDRIVPLLR
jgi:hypothetical protein